MSLWSQAAAVAAKTPETRNRYVDFLRAVSILAVISGHWLVAAPYVGAEGQLSLPNLLARQPWTQWLTWAFQVMPVFFFVGGYSNGVSWNAAMRDGRGYASWLDARLQRLIGPVLPLIVVWAVLAIVASQMGARPEMIKVGSQLALIPIWFLAVYIMAVLLVPLTYSAWQRYGLLSFGALVFLALANDVLFFAADLPAVGWINYGFIWLAVHQLGYAWRDGQLKGGLKALPWALGGLALLLGLVFLGPYPLAMVSVPGDEISNTLPPKLPMLALGVTQIGLMLTLEAPMRRWLRRPAPWTATVLVNGMIMTIFLWHLTSSTIIIGGALQMGNVGLTVEPGTGLWWALRPAWIASYLIGLAILALGFSRFERGGAGVAAAAWRLVGGAALVGLGLALLALDGVGGGGRFGLSPWVALPFVGALIAGVNPLRSRS